MRDSGQLVGGSALELAGWVSSESFTEVGIGLATLNALLPTPTGCVYLTAEDYISQRGGQARVALIGHFPFVSSLKTQVKELWVLELNPQEGDLPTSSAAQIIPQADILAITATTLINRSFDSLFALRRPDTKVILLGPSTPLSPRLFDMGIHVLSGSIIEDSKTVLTLVQQGATFRQIKNHGRLGGRARNPFRPHRERKKIHRHVVPGSPPGWDTLYPGRDYHGGSSGWETWESPGTSGNRLIDHNVELLNIQR